MIVFPGGRRVSNVRMVVSSLFHWDFGLVRSVNCFKYDYLSRKAATLGRRHRPMSEGMEAGGAQPREMPPKPLLARGHHPSEASKAFCCAAAMWGPNPAMTPGFGNLLLNAT